MAKTMLSIRGGKGGRVESLLKFDRSLEPACVPQPWMNSSKFHDSTADTLTTLSNPKYLLKCVRGAPKVRGLRV